MSIKGYYFLNTNICNGRAHSIQALKTVEEMNNIQGLSLEVVAPSFVKKERRELFKDYGIINIFPVRLLFNYGFNMFGRVQIMLYTLTSLVYFLYIRTKRKIDFVYIRNDLLYFVALGAYITRIPFFFEIHRTPQKRWEKTLREWLVVHATGIIVITDSLEEYYKDKNSNIIISECGFDDRLFKRGENKDKNVVSLGYAGGLEEHHGIGVVLKGMEGMKEVEFIVIGGTNKQIERLKRNAPQNVTFVGKVSYKDVPKLLYGIDILLLPQLRGDRGAVSSKMYDYFGLGKAIVASDIPANIFRMKERENALFYKANNPEDFKKVLDVLVSDKVLRNSMGENNFSKSKDYTFSKRAEKMSKFIRELLEKQ